MPRAHWADPAGDPRLRGRSDRPETRRQSRPFWRADDRVVLIEEGAGPSLARRAGAGRRRRRVRAAFAERKATIKQASSPGRSASVSAIRLGRPIRLVAHRTVILPAGRLPRITERQRRADATRATPTPTVECGACACQFRWSDTKWPIQPIISGHRLPVDSRRRPRRDFARGVGRL